MITREECRATEYTENDNQIDKEYIEYEKALENLESRKTKLEASYESKDGLVINKVLLEYSSYLDTAYSRINLLTLRGDLVNSYLQIFSEGREVFDEIMDRRLEEIGKAEAKAMKVKAKLEAKKVKLELEIKEEQRLMRNARQRERRAAKRVAALAEV